MDVQERFRILETRCSSFAVELLRELRDHPQISELVADLEKIDGPIYRTDIENAFTAIRKADGS